MKTRLFCLLLALLVLSGCMASKPPPSTFYYVLDDKASTYAEKRTNTIVKILPVLVPDYMNQPNLVLKLSDHQIKITNYHFWAEDLRQSIQRIVINELNGSNANVTFTQRCENCTQVMIMLHHYYPTESGDVVLSGSYQIIGTSGTQQQAFSFTRSLTKGGYDDAVANMRLLLNDLSKDINSKLAI